jgi:L-lactate dehydrogenase complex protein LldF
MSASNPSTGPTASSRPDTFASRAAAAVADPNQRAVMRRAVAHLAGLRARALAAIPDVEARRDRAACVRERTLAALPDLLVRLEENLTRAGAVVHYARDAAEANGIIGDLALSRGVSRVVKGKSMVTEELNLNAHLQGLGLEVFETDLGEYIVQLAGQKPSHIISPALHLSRGEVADLFAEKLGRTGETAPELTMVARRELREKFVTAGMGVTGVNVAVAGSGCLVLVENEGNIRLSTACPPLHVAVMTLEKVVGDFADLADIVDVLPPFATGQTMPGSLSLFFGPRRPGEADGPRELHLVILDNGRSALRADPELSSILRCIRCGACLNVCPVYGTVGGHAYGSNYPGPMGTVLAGALEPLSRSAPLAFACTMCGACSRACPVRIDHPAIILELRRRAARAGCGPLPEALARAYAFALRHPLAYRAAVGLLRGVDPGLRKLAALPGMEGMAAYLGQREGFGLKPPFVPEKEEKERNKGVGASSAVKNISSSSPLASGSPVLSGPERACGAPTPFQGSAADLVPLFEAAGVTARVCTSPEDLARELAEVARESGAKTAAAWDHPLLERLGAARLLAEGGVAVIAPPAARNATGNAAAHSPSDAATPGVCAGIEGADLGLCAAEALLAATGTVVLAPGPGRPRATALLPPVLLVLADPATALADLRAFLPLAADWRDRRDPSGLFCVTGPSATGDIEFVYVQGAHGPTRVVVLLADY